MAIYTIVVKRDSIQYSISSDDKDFIISHISMVFSQLKNREEKIGDAYYTKLDVAPLPQKDYFSKEQEYANKKKEFLELSTLLQPDLREEKSQENENDLEQSDNNNLIDSFEERSITEFQAEAGKVESDEKNEEPQPNSNADERSSNNVSSDFENILAEKINNPVYIEESFKSYEDIISEIKPESLLDYLIITAYYMHENENKHTFQLKQLNSKLYGSMKIMVDRKTVQKAVEDGLLTVILNADEASGVVEYALTQSGKEYYLNASA